MPDITLGQLLLIIFLVLLNAFFVASEFAFVKVRPTQMHALIALGSRRARRVKQIIDDLDRSLSSTQLGITIASISLGIMGEEFFKELILVIIELFAEITGIQGDRTNPLIDASAFVFGFLIITFMHITVGELAPKSISIQFAEKTALMLAEPLYWFMYITSPFLSFFVWVSNNILRLFRIEPLTESHHRTFTEDELRLIIEDSIKDGELEKYESKLIFNILNFTDRNVRSVLTPRIDVKALRDDVSPKKILSLAQKTGFSRIPIYGQNLDDIQGFVHVKDLIGLVMEDPESSIVSKADAVSVIKSILRPVINAHEGNQLDYLFKKMQNSKTQLATIVDKYGSLKGIVTMEDILEYIVGPIEDEFDRTAVSELEVIDDLIQTEGLINIETLNETIDEIFGVEIQPESTITLAGYILELSDGELPLVTTKVRDEHLEFTITKVEGNRIMKVSIRKTSD
ncbi:MAG: HlyC/CorC family transporter [Candidatus Heimdallarchaeota archaeon]|nr:HlyC/CorC family transporter [Candidatus Heimdallarchaeota archaeon]